MKLSASTGICQGTRGSDLLVDMNEVIRIMREVGYEVADINLGSHDKANYMLRGDDWQQQVDKVADTAAKLGMEFYQCHMPYIPGCAPGVSKDWVKPEYQEYFRECMRRASIANGMLGVKWAVFHPIYCPEQNYERKAALDANHALYDDYVELCIKNGTDVAYENMLPSLKRIHPIRYGTHYEELIELIDSYQDSMVGACWDTGHANQMKLDQGRAVRVLGQRLKVLHINDNFYGVRDEHLLPYMGTVNWNGFLEALVEVGYQGTLNYETGKVSKNASGAMQLELVKMCYRNGLYLLGVYEQMKKNAEEKAGCQK